MKLTRLIQSTDTTIGFLRYGDIGVFTLEDIARETKVPGKTRIPAGTYQIKLRTEGAVAQKYLQRFSWHKGMLWLQDVPNFEWIYIHMGHTHIQTEGCLTVGYTAQLNAKPMSIMDSSAAYCAIYQRACIALAKGPLTITIEDEPHG
jgi:hypothetical protein